jgi:spermidine synthase
VRYLHFSSDWIQGAMRIARPWALELDYTREMMACLLLKPQPEWPRHALLIGLGAGSLAKFLFRHRPHTQLTVVEIDAQVLAAARQHFKLPEDAQRLRIEIDDGVRYVAHASETYDQACRARLASEGMMVVNLLGRSRGFRASVDRIRNAFDDRALVFPSCDAGNTIVFATTGPAVEHYLGELKLGARSLQRETGLKLLPTLARLEQAGTCAGGVLRL